MLETNAITKSINEGLILQGYYTSSLEDKKNIVMEQFKRVTLEQMGVLDNDKYDIYDVLYLLNERLNSYIDKRITFESYDNCLLNIMSNLQGYFITKGDGNLFVPEVYSNNLGYVSEITMNSNREPVENTVFLMNYFMNTFMMPQKATKVYR